MDTSPPLCAFCDAPIVTGEKSRRARPRVVCDRPECRSKACRFGARKLQAINARRKAEAPPKTTHTCARCKRTLPWTPEFFYVNKRDEDGTPVVFDRWCKEDRRAYQREVKSSAAAKQRAARKRDRERERMATDAAYREHRRVQAREAARRRRARDPEGVREAARRYRERVKADPKRAAVARENERIARRLRKERAGLPMNERKRTEGERAEGREPRLPSGPIVRFIERIPDDGTREALCSKLGIGDRQLRRWKSGESAGTPRQVVDRLLMTTGRIVDEIYPADAYPEVHAAFA